MTGPLTRQIWTMSSVLMNMFGQGLVLGYPTTLLSALNQPDSPIKIDLHMASWLGSINGAAGILGLLISSSLMDLIGRRITHALLILPGALGWLLIYFANNITTLMIGKGLGGFSSFGTVPLGAIVIGEYTCPKYRGVFLYLKNAAVCIGALFIHILSRFLHWKDIALIALIPLIVSLMINYTWPESPAWLISKQQYAKSEEIFYWLRGKTESSRREIRETIKAQKERLSKPKLKLSYKDSILIFFKKFTQKDFLKPLTIMILATIVLEMSGRHVFPSYALQIMAEMTGERSQSFYYALGIDVTITVSAVFASILVKMINRRTLLFFTGFAALGVLMATCMYLALASRGIISNDYPAIPISMLLLYFTLANLGCAPIPLALVGEVFPVAHRGVGTALSGVWISFCLIVALKSTPHLLVNIKIYGLFTVCGLLMGVSLFLLYFLLPETKDRTLQEIENYFNYGKFTNDDDEEANVKMLKTVP